MKRRLRLTAVRPWRQWTLRARLVLATAALASVALVVADAAGIALLHQNRYQRPDAGLDAQAHRPIRFDNARGDRAPGFGQLTRTYLYRPDGSLSRATGTSY